MKLILWGLGFMVFLFVYLWLQFTIVEFKDRAVREAINNIQSQQKDIQMLQQAKVMAQQKVAFVKSQKMILDSKATEKKIISSVSTTEKLSVKYAIIKDINCMILNFDDPVICEK